jgi:hypothetical protein
MDMLGLFFDYVSSLYSYNQSNLNKTVYSLDISTHTILFW